MAIGAAALIEAGLALGLGGAGAALAVTQDGDNYWTGFGIGLMVLGTGLALDAVIDSISMAVARRRPASSSPSLAPPPMWIPRSNVAISAILVVMGATGISLAALIADEQSSLQAGFYTTAMLFGLAMLPWSALQLARAKRWRRCLQQRSKLSASLTGLTVRF